MLSGTAATSPAPTFFEGIRVRRTGNKERDDGEMKTMRELSCATVNRRREREGEERNDWNPSENEGRGMAPTRTLWRGRTSPEDGSLGGEAGPTQGFSCSQENGKKIQSEGILSSRTPTTTQPKYHRDHHVQVEAFRRHNLRRHRARLCYWSLLLSHCFTQ